MSIHNLLGTGPDGKTFQVLGVQDLNAANISAENMATVNDLNVLGSTTGIGLDDLDDVSLVAVANGDFIQWDNLQQRWVNVPSSGVGEDNTASNVGGGEGLFKQKVGVDLEFKSLVGGNRITLTPAADTVDVDFDGIPFTDLTDVPGAYPGPNRLVNIDGAGTGLAFTDVSGSGTAVLEASAAGVVSRGPALASGTFTPSLSSIVNLSIVQAGTVHWTRVGNIVTGTFFTAINFGGASPSIQSFEMTIPVARTAGNFSNGAEAKGSAVCYPINNVNDNLNGGAGDNYSEVAVTSVGGSQRLLVRMSRVSQINTLFRLSGTYTYSLT